MVLRAVGYVSRLQNPNEDDYSRAFGNKLSVDIADSKRRDRSIAGIRETLKCIDIRPIMIIFDGCISIVCG